LIGIGKDLVGANDLSEFEACVGIAGMEVGMRSLDRTTEGTSQLFGVIARKSSEQIVQRIHRRTHDYSTKLAPPKLPPRIRVENRALIEGDSRCGGRQKDD